MTNLTDVLSTQEIYILIVFKALLTNRKKVENYIGIQSVLISITWIFLILLSNYSYTLDLLSDLLKCYSLFQNIQLISSLLEPSKRSVLRSLLNLILKHFESNFAFINHTAMIPCSPDLADQNNAIGHHHHTPSENSICYPKKKITFKLDME